MRSLEKFRLWLKGSFVCKSCGREFYVMFFGYGKTICPDCYDGELPFLFFDGGFWLNRITAQLLGMKTYTSRDCIP